MAYANMALARGPERFARALADAGASGAIVPDLPLEEGGEVAAALQGRRALARAAGRPDDPARAPAPDLRRRPRASSTSSPTPARPASATALPEALAELVEAARADSPVPVAVGFGIGTPELAAQVGEIADGVIIGSRLVRAVDEAADQREAAAAVASFLTAARSAMSSAGDVD